jgi:hypothetical protein
MATPSKAGQSTGAKTSGYEESPERKRRRRQQEKRWAKKCGPVTVRYVDPDTLR